MANLVNGKFNRLILLLFFKSVASNNLTIKRNETYAVMDYEWKTSFAITSDGPVCKEKEVLISKHCIGITPKGPKWKASLKRDCSICPAMEEDYWLFWKGNGSHVGWMAYINCSEHINQYSTNDMFYWNTHTKQWISIGKIRISSGQTKRMCSIGPNTFYGTIIAIMIPIGFLILLFGFMFCVCISNRMRKGDESNDTDSIGTIRSYVSYIPHSWYW